MMDLGFWAPVICAGAVAGGSTGLTGVYIVGMRIPFLGVCTAHAALAGGVFGALAGLTGVALLGPALAAAAATALLLGLLDPQAARIDANVLLGLLFSLTMGLAFLGLGLFSRYGISDNEVRSLLWGSLMFCRWSDFAVMAGAAGVQLAFLGTLGKEMRAIMFSREHARAAGVRVRLVWTAFLVITAAVLTVNFRTVGGLMLFSLIANPAAAAFQLVRGHGKALALATAIGAVSGVGGFLIAAAWDLPTGPMIVILSSAFVALSACARVLPRRRRGNDRPDSLASASRSA